jgi:hypothetical protein
MAGCGSFVSPFIISGQSSHFLLHFKNAKLVYFRNEFLSSLSTKRNCSTTMVEYFYLTTFTNSIIKSEIRIFFHLLSLGTLIPLALMSTFAFS